MRGAIFFSSFALCLLFLALLAGRQSNSRMNTSVRVFSLSVFFVVVCTIFICAVFLWAPEYLCDHGLDLGDELNERETTNNTRQQR